MGIPAAFRWLSNKYPKIISPVVEERPIRLDDGTFIPIDISSRNPNGEEFDNLYLDMNGIVHPCSHPEDKPAPKDEEEMMLEIFKYTDRIVNMVRPRKILMIAVGMTYSLLPPFLLAFFPLPLLSAHEPRARWCCSTSENESAAIEAISLSTGGAGQGS